MEEQISDHWVKIFETDNPITAEIVKQSLSEAGIHAVVMNKQIAAYNMGAVEVLVNINEEAQAKALIATQEF